MSSTDSNSIDVWGRPTKYKPEYDKLVIEYIQKTGKTFVHFANSIGVHRDTLAEWCKNYPSFSVAFKAAKQIHLEWCFQKMESAETPVEFNKAKWYFAAMHRVADTAPMDDVEPENGTEIGFVDVKARLRASTTV